MNFLSKKMIFIVNSRLLQVVAPAAGGWTEYAKLGVFSVVTHTGGENDIYIKQYIIF